MAAGEKAESGVRSVLLAFDVLEAVAAAPDEVGVSELANRLGTTKGTVFRHLQTLAERGYVSQNPSSSRYKLGVQAHLLGQAASGRIDLLSAAEAPARSLREDTGITVVVSAVSARGVTVLTTLLGKHNLEIGVRPGSELALHATAQGKVAVAFSHPSLLPLVRRRGLRRMTEHTIHDPDVLAEHLERCIAEGFATAPEEETLGISALAAPILDRQGHAAGTIAIVGSIQHIPRNPPPAQIEAILRAAAKISWELGYAGRIPAQARE
jgi:IclR family transcriptional regulator, KDG regulon repressor